MAIRNHKHPTSNIYNQEKNFFLPKDQTFSNRFLFMEKGKKSKSFIFKYDMTDPNLDLHDEEFIILEEKYVNRIDLIAFKFYENSKYWWLIALRNNISDPLKELTKGTRLLIPKLHIIKNKILFFTG